MRIEDVAVDSELEEFLPPLSDHEFSLLKDNIQKHGFSDPIVIWLGRCVIVDGHNRYRIWQQLGSDLDNCPDIVERRFADRHEAMEWMFTRQSARRNWTAAQKAMSVLAMKSSISEKAKRNQKGAGGDKKSEKQREKSLLPNSAKAIDTRAELAKLAGVGRDVIAKVEKVLANGKEETKRKMKSGELSANAAYKETVVKNPGKPDEKEVFGKNFNPEDFDPEMNRNPKNGKATKFKEEVINKSMRELVQAIARRRLEISGGDEGYAMVRSALDSLAKGLEKWRLS